ncbi:MAG TPA: trypsin-like peptidase domain-containing protein, partial [Tepidisphaeraceae bacterium]|nr:trypsin-like peptidase domain-containing protein [Tepidisphaeraceae bacterium]
MVVRGALGQCARFAIVVATGFLPTTFSHTLADDKAPRPQLIDSSDTVELAGLEDQFAAVARRVSPSVVAISATISATPNEEAVRSATLNTEKLENILDRTTRTVGTGFVIDADGYILTNEHVIGEAEQIWVTTDQRKVYPAIVVGSDPRADLAVLKIPATNLTPVMYAKPETLRRGEWNIAVGNPYGLAGEGEMCMSVGVISALDRALPKLASKEGRLYQGLIQTTAQINPGNSGGPLFNLKGEVIGINTAVIMPQKQTNGIGFAMPLTSTILQKVQMIKDGREVIYGYLGVTVSTPSARERHDLGLADDQGVLIETIENGSAAFALLKSEDMVLAVNGKAVHTSDEFVDLIGVASIEAPSKIEVLRDGKRLSVEVPVRKRVLPNVAVTRENQRFRWRGMLIGPIPANWNLSAKTEKKPGASGLMVLAVEKDSPMARQGIATGTIITAVAGKTV